MKQWHLAEFWEAVADTVPDAPALVEQGTRRSWSEYEQRSACVAAALDAAGLGLGSKVGLYGYNSIAYVEAHFGIFKIRGVPINVNYLYTEPELVYLLDNADVEALVFDARFGPRVEAICNELPKLKLLIEINDGTGCHLAGAQPLEGLIAAHRPMPRRTYSPDDIFMFYTGGTTGKPKGVMFRHGDLIQIVLTGFDLRGMNRPESIAELAAALKKIHALNMVPTTIPACPLMHGAGLWAGVFMTHNVGGCVVLFRNEHFDPDGLWRLAERSRATDIVIVGDAFARPMLGALVAAKAADSPYDLSRLKVIFSSGVIFSREVKDGLLSFADITILDTLGGTEGPMAGTIVSRSSPPTKTAMFMPHPTTKVFDQDDKEILPGSDEVGVVANGGFVPVGYYKDPGKSAATFRVINGRRYAILGDMAKLATDGSLILLGRGSACINTGGEKVFPEEVDAVLQSHPDVCDCLTVGAPDERFGERLIAILSLQHKAAIDEKELIAFVKTRLASYKAPRQIVIVNEVRRGANGKPDYKWAKSVALQSVPTNAGTSKAPSANGARC